jgi:ribosomal protein S12 methylthiotransferase accessory factor
LLHVVAARETPLAQGAPVMTDVDRARYWTSSGAVAGLRAWCQTFQLQSAPSPATHEPPASEIVGALLADGARPVAVDLTSRLPQAVRDGGWAVVKVIAVGYQPLRMNETHDFTWVRPRLATAAERTGCPSPLTGDAWTEAGPHPLI